jgi:membrane fusion protein, multidrug efflux system
MYKKIRLQMKRFNAVIIALLFGASLLPSCSGGNKKLEANAEQVKQAENVKEMILESKTIGRDLDFSTNMLAVEEVNLVPVSPGRIDKINVEVGSRVKQGQVLVLMDQTSLQQAKIQIANLENDFKRYETLKETGAISQQIYDQTLAQLNVQKTTLKYLQSNTTIKAPFSGIISAKNYENGEMYSGAKPIVTIVQVNNLKAYIDIPETYYPLIKKGMKAKVESDTYPDKTFTATVFNIAPTINSSTRTFEVEMRVPNSGETLKPGMYGNITLSMGQVKAVVVPYQSVLKLQGSNERYVFVDRNGKAKRYDVSLGQRFDDQVEIICDSIKQGDKLIIAGQARLVDGDKLNVVE